MPAVPVPGVCSGGRCRHTGHRVIQKPDVEAGSEHETRHREVEEGGVDHQVRDTLPEARHWSLVARLIAGEKREKQAPARKTRPRPSNLLEPNTCVRKAQRVRDAAAFV